MPEEQIAFDLELQRPLSPRVTLIASHRTIAEYPLYLKYLLVGLADESVPVQLVCPPLPEANTIVPPAVEVVRHPAVNVPFLERYNLGILLDHVSRFQPDVIHCLCESKAALARRLTRRLGIKYVVNVNSVVSRFRFFSLSTSRCAAIVAPTKTIADSFAASHHRFSDRIRQINIGVFVSDTTACFAHPERLPCIAVAHPFDNPDYFRNLFEALHRLAIESYEFMVALVGSGRAESQVRKLLISLDLLRLVTIIYRMPGIDSALSSADVFVVPRPSSRVDSLLLNAMSVGSAVAACTGGVDDLIIDGETALTFNHDDQLSIYNCLKRLFDTRELARQIASGAQQRLRQNHHVSDMVAATLQLYRQAGCPSVPRTESPAA